MKIDLVLSLLTLNLALQNDPGGMRTAWLVLSFAWGAIYLFGAFFGEQDE